MDFYKTFSVGLLILAACLQSSLCSWTYPPIRVTEGYENLPLRLAQIKSDNPAAVKYELRGEGVGTEFKIDPTDGWVSQFAEVDREKKDQYSVVASALNIADERVEEDVTLVIEVLDQNDNEPKFVDSSLSGSVPEASDASSGPFMTVSATDADINMNGVAGFKFSIAPSTDKPPASSARFSINEKTGQVSVAGTLDYEVDPIVYFSVVVEDGGKSYGIARTASVTVQVQDSNDHKPIIDPTPAKSVSELFPLNVDLYEISTSDVDEGVNKEVYFEIVSGNTGGTFKVMSYPSDSGKSIGKIQLEKKLDYEDGERQYSLRVKAYNKLAENANSDAMAEFATIQFTVTDGNEPPEFLSTPYNSIVSESREPPFQLSTTVSARDRDFGGNQTIAFSISDDPENWFVINPDTGVITATSKLDREANSVKNGIYSLGIMAKDNYPGNQASDNAIVAISITDINDNPPKPDWADDTFVAKVCEVPTNATVTLITAEDPDDNEIGNGYPFIFKFDTTIDKNQWSFEMESQVASKVITFIEDFDLPNKPSKYELPFTISDAGSPTQVGTYTLTVSICACTDGKFVCDNAAVVGAGFPVAIIIAIIVIILLIIILVLAAVAYKRRQDAKVLKEPFFNDEDDVRENLQVYQEEGGEEDQQAYDLSALQAPLIEPHAPIRIEQPQKAAPVTRAPRGPVPDDIGSYIDDAKDQADNDPSAPPFDSLLVFDYEGLGSDAGSLSSINTATTDGSMDYDYLNDWGPRFKKLADMYTGGSDTE